MNVIMMSFTIIVLSFDCCLDMIISSPNNQAEVFHIYYNQFEKIFLVSAYTKFLSLYAIQLQEIHNLNLKSIADYENYIRFTIVVVGLPGRYLQYWKFPILSWVEVALNIKITPVFANHIEICSGYFL